jgi:hypothetical protein
MIVTLEKGRAKQKLVLGAIATHIKILLMRVTWSLTMAFPAIGHSNGDSPSTTFCYLPESSF